MLTPKQKEKIRNIGIYEYSSSEENGKPLTYKGQEFHMLSCDEIRKEVLNKILRVGFSKVNFVNPARANCVVRVFVLKHFKYDNELVYNIYGAHCFTRKNGRWVSRSQDSSFELDYAKCIIRHWFFQDEYADFELDFFDTYVHVS